MVEVEVLTGVSSRSRIRSRLGRFKEAIGLFAFKRAFVGRAGGGIDTIGFRRSLVRRFELIHKRIVCAHQEAEALILAEAILDLHVNGPVVELGCFKGGSTAKLSVVCETVNRELYVCDSFEGLPRPTEGDAVHFCCSGRVKHYSKGDYCASLDEVKTNVAAVGAINVCRFVEGPFTETLPGLDVRPALMFMDVDLVESARECLRHLWRRIPQGGKIFTHEAGAHTFVRGLLDNEWWHRELGQCPPILFGAGYGQGSHAANLAYLERSPG